MLFITLATPNRLFVLKDYTAFSATNYEDYSQLNKLTIKL
jgi:hypothetical protein